ncbi:hypothetical protein M23134_05359 [Microscilla marina ATCC 23134]|uniref:Uncharacterized protein n=1 Tax=Microscilla marina ATCC 23134 TaxID=313606 RepID=A1ZHL9_MICM2|nr:hypothetical protein M23134_05359 [Microscilla marina ATCC 23134]
MFSDKKQNTQLLFIDIFAFKIHLLHNMKVIFNFSTQNKI